MYRHVRCKYYLNKLGKNILKDISRYWKLCIYANLACAYQGYIYHLYQNMEDAKM